MKDSLRIGFYTDTYLPNMDGVVFQILAMKSEMEKRGNYVHVFAAGTLSEKNFNRDKSVDFYPAFRFPPYPQYKVAVFPYSSVFDVRRLQLDVIHCHALATMGLAAVHSAKTLSLPLVGTFHTMVPLAMHYVTQNKNAQKVLSKAAWQGVKLFYLPFDAVTAPSHVIARLLREHGVENVKVISNGINLEKFNSHVDGRQVRRKLGIKPSEKLVAFVGRVTKEKNIDVVLRAAKKASTNGDANFKLAIIGNGPALEECKLLSRRLGLRNVIFTGAISHEEIPSYLAAADWQITASTFETQGLGIIEGLACGKPCIGANSLAIPEAVKQGKNGFLFEPFDVENCAEQLARGLNLSENQYNKMSAFASSDAKKYSIEKTTSEILKLYGKVL